MLKRHSGTSRCCACNGVNARCKSCACVKAGRSCSSCQPSKRNRCSNSGAPLVASLHNSDLPFSSQPVFPLTDAHLCEGLTQSNSQPFPPQHWVHYLLQLVHGCSCFPVNHSVEFVNPTTGVHTQHIESYWNRVKKRLKSMKGVNSLQLPSYLDEFMWRERYGSTSQEAFNSVLRDISLQYVV